MNRIKRVLDYQLTIGDLIVLAILIGIPYGIVGLVWSFTHLEHLDELDSGWNQFCSFIGQIVAWPVLLICDVNLR